MPNDLEQEVEVQVEETVEAEPEVVEEVESVEDLKKRLATTIAQKDHYKKLATETKDPIATTKTASLSPGDLVAVMNAKVHEDDMERVERFAISEGLSVREALKSPELKAILDVRAEQRNTAIATNVENVRRGVVQVSDDALLNQARAGRLPESDDEIERLIRASYKNK